MINQPTHLPTPNLTKPDSNISPRNLEDHYLQLANVVLQLCKRVLFITFQTRHDYY